MSEADERWDELFDEVAEEVKAWRKAHPTATLSEIEAAIDSRVARVRRRMKEDLAQGGQTADLNGLAEEERPRCPQCERVVMANGKQRRRLTTDYEQSIELERSKAYCPDCGISFFPPG